MLSRKSFGLISVLIFILEGIKSQATFALVIIPSQPGATQFYREESTYTIRRNLRGTTTIDKRLWLEPLPLGGSAAFDTGLNLWAFGSVLGGDRWDFQPAQEDLQGSFEVVTYQACGQLLMGLNFNLLEILYLRELVIFPSWKMILLPSLSATPS